MATAGTAGLVMGTGQPADAQEPAGIAAPAAADVAAAIAEVGWHADDESAGDREQLGAAAERLARERQQMGFALPGEEPAGVKHRLRRSVLDVLIGWGERSIRTVVVLSDADVGVVNELWRGGASDGDPIGTTSLRAGVALAGRSAIADPRSGPRSAPQLAPQLRWLTAPIVERLPPRPRRPAPLKCYSGVDLHGVASTREAGVMVEASVISP
jgi:hypothetical protein